MKPNTILFEIAWEVCNQIGGIFTYLKSRIPTMIDTYEENYFLIGPYFSEHAKADFRPVTEIENEPLSRTVRAMRALGFEIHYGYWLLDDSRPRVLLINPRIHRNVINQVKGNLWDNYEVSTINPDETIDLVIGFGEVLRLFLTLFDEEIEISQDVLVHFHEWMSASCLPALVDDKVRLATVFTTHATLLGRYLAPNEPDYFTKLQSFDWLDKAVEYNIEGRVALERIIAQKAHCFIADSENTSRECEAFFDRKPDAVIYNGIHKTPAPRYELFHVYQQNREKIDAFVKALFLPSYPVNTDKTLYFITSGRYEYRNKGFDVTLEAAARLNYLLKSRGSDINVILFVVSKRPFYNIKTDVLEARQRYHDLKKVCGQISHKLGPALFSKLTVADGRRLPDLNGMVDDELLRTWKQSVANFKGKQLPATVTHELVEEDDIVRFCKTAGLDNKQQNPVKIIYHPDFIERAKSLFGIDYHDFVKGCNLGIFPSLYEPWGYTPMETVLGGTPVITSDTSGFGQFISETLAEPERDEMYIVNRKSVGSDDLATEQLTDILQQFCASFEKDFYIPRASMSKAVTDSICWVNLQPRYHEAYRLAFIRSQPDSHAY